MRAENMHKSALSCYPLRLGPGEEIKSALLDFVKRNNLKAPFVLTCCGSVKMATLRYAELDDNTQKIETLHNHYEITSLVGTLSGERGHLHITLSDKAGGVIGGHVVGDLVVFTTAEIVIGDCTGAVFTREHDDATGFDELCIKSDEEA